MRLDPGGEGGRGARGLQAGRGIMMAMLGRACNSGWGHGRVSGPDQGDDCHRKGGHARIARERRAIVTGRGAGDWSLAIANRLAIEEEVFASFSPMWTRKSTSEAARLGVSTTDLTHGGRCLGRGRRPLRHGGRGLQPAGRAGHPGEQCRYRWTASRSSRWTSAFWDRVMGIEPSKGAFLTSARRWPGAW